MMYHGITYYSAVHCELGPSKPGKETPRSNLQEGGHISQDWDVI